MILLCGIPSEAPLRLVIEAAQELGAEYALFNQRECRDADLELRIRNGRLEGTLRIRGTDYPLSAFTGVYVRLMDHQDLPENRPAGRMLPERDWLEKSSLFHEGLVGWFEMADCLVMNRCSAMSSNASKPYQAQFIARAGFKTPATLITNDPGEVRCFLRAHRRVIYKSISSVRSIVRELRDVKMNDLGKIRNLPTQFQAFVPGTNIRVHVVGKEVFATEIRSEAVDYRYARRDDQDVEMAPIVLPPAVEMRCLDLSRVLALPLCGIDLKRTPDNDYYCFEVNPSPGYSYYQALSGQDIAKAIVRSLQ